MANRNSQNGIFILLGVLGAALVAVVVFGHPPPSMKAPLVKPDVALPSKSLDINVYLDGSGSIKHFLQRPSAKDSAASPAHNYVEDLLDKTENVLHNAPGSGADIWTDHPLHQWKFGAGDPKPLPPGKGLAWMASNLDAFDEKDTLIEKPIDQARSGGDSDARPELKIILTDLYESNGQLGAPAEKLADKYLNDNIGAVGILAVRSPFAGPVEDLPGSTKKTPPIAADSMPFYVIFAGPAGDVRHAMDVMVNGIDLKEALRTGKAVQFFFSRAAQPHDADIKMHFSPVGGYSNVSTNYQNTHIPFIKLRKGVLTVQWSDPQREDPGSIQIAAAEKLVASVQAVGAKGKLQDDGSSRAAEPCTGSEPFCMTIDRPRLNSKTTYVFQFDVVQNQPADTLKPDSDVMKHWNIEVPAAENISRMPSPSFPLVNGRKPGLTPSLALFLSSLQDQMFHAPVRATSYYLYVQAD